MLKESIIDSVKDLKFVISRGYKRPSALKFVGDKYGLNKIERHILFRSVYPPEIIKAPLKKLIPIEKIEGKILGIDGFNLIITLEAIIKGNLIIICEDGLIRDISAVFEKFKATETTYKSLNLIFNLLKSHKPSEVIFLLDSPISNSGKLAEVIKNFYTKYNLKGEAKTSKNVDTEILKNEIVASSDNIIIDKAEKVVDIPHFFIKTFKGELLNFKE